MLFGATLLVGCTATVPEEYTEAKTLPTIYPQYSDITIPYNIAPLNVAYEMEGKEFITELKVDDHSLVTRGKQTDWNLKRWHALLASAKGKTVLLNTYVRSDEGWVKHRSIKWRVAEEPIDPYISYRIIAPSYVTYEELSIRQRELATFDEQMIYNNMLLNTDKDGQCINCHSYKNYKT